MQLVSRCCGRQVASLFIQALNCFFGVMLKTGAHRPQPHAPCPHAYAFTIPMPCFGTPFHSGTSRTCKSSPRLWMALSALPALLTLRVAQLLSSNPSLSYVTLSSAPAHHSLASVCAIRRPLTQGLARLTLRVCCRRSHGSCGGGERGRAGGSCQLCHHLSRLSQRRRLIPPVPPGIPHASMQLRGWHQWMLIH